ncbi:hypothetical protein CHARACLAT_031190 [Characodon lateralis]|uniref:Uncharacterized protein n=1 Tax=Characodon lateralis TaxID=208331 RepID=A0ABU7D5J3_9TELE|nr:hypothetical protein [Characodon lateralis]
MLVTPHLKPHHHTHCNPSAAPPNPSHQHPHHPDVTLKEQHIPSSTNTSNPSPPIHEKQKNKVNMRLRKPGISTRANQPPQPKHQPPQHRHKTHSTAITAQRQAGGYSCRRKQRKKATIASQSPAQMWC